MTAGDRLTTRVVYLNMASRIDYDEMWWGKKAKTRHQEKEKMREEIGPYVNMNRIGREYFSDFSWYLCYLLSKYKGRCSPDSYYWRRSNFSRNVLYSTI
jgi:hypothetical protein